MAASEETSVYNSLEGGCPVHGDEYMRECSMCGCEFCRTCFPRSTVCPDCAEEKEDKEDEEEEAPKDPDFDDVKDVDELIGKDQKAGDIPGGDEVKPPPHRVRKEKR